MEENQVSNPQTVCPKCGKSVQSDFTRCPYCGAKLGTSSNNVKDFKEKAKSILQSIVKVAKAHKKATIGIVVALVVIIALIPIISAITSPFNSLKANSVSVGYQTAEEVEKQFGKPTDVLTDTSSSLPASCDEVWVYYPDSIDNQIKSINKMLENANSFSDLDKADREYQKLTEKKYKQVVIGISDDKVVFYSLNTQAMYNEEDLFATKNSKQLSKCTFNKTMVCRDTTVSDNKITFTAKFSDGSIFMGKVSSYSQVDEKNPKVEFDCPWSKLSLTLNIVDHYFNSNCTCKNCGLEDHDIVENCMCSKCNQYFHQMSGCECIKCSYNTHNPNSNCICTICDQVAHRLDEHCLCSTCGKYNHSFDEECDCKNCDTAFTIESDGTSCTIKHFKGYGDIEIPSTYKGLPVTSIEVNAFSDNGYAIYPVKITSITIPDSVTSIGSYAFFNCRSLTSITIPDSVLRIGRCAFSGCSRLTSINIPDSVTSIGSSAFYETAWYDNQPDGVVYAGKVAYKYKGTMPSNTSIVLKDGTLAIANGAFSNCSELTSIIIPDSVTSIGHGAFEGCNSLESMSIPFVGEIKDGSSNKYFGYIFGAGNYGSNSYYVPSSLKSVKITGGTSLGIGAFDGCSSLKSITIPNGVTSIGDSAFEGCSSLTSINFQGTQAQWKAISKDDFWNYETGNYTICCTDGNISKTGY